MDFTDLALLDLCGKRLRMYRLPDTTKPLDFPNDFETTVEGLLAIGGNLHPQTLVNAYAKGIFPWYDEGDPILWWHPSPRLVIYPHKAHTSRKMSALIKKSPYRIAINQNFEHTIAECAQKRGPKRQSTWILPDMQQAYCELHRHGYAHSIEVYNPEDKLVGGMYGVALGKVFFGESMFSHEPNTSKLALLFLCNHLKNQDFLFLDCQIESEHLKTLGAELISRQDFLTGLKEGQTHSKQPWQPSIQEPLKK